MNDDDLTTGASAPELDYSALPKVGSIVRKGNGYAVVVAHGPALVPRVDDEGRPIRTADPRPVPGLIVAELGQANDLPHTPEALGIGAK